MGEQGSARQQNGGKEEHRGVHKEMQGWIRHGKANQRRCKPCKRRPGMKAVDRSRRGWLCKVVQGKEVVGFTRQSKQEVQPRIAPRQKLPIQTGLPGINVFWASSHLHLKHWGYVLYFLWKRTVIFIQELMAKILISPPKCNIFKNCSQMKSARTDGSGLALASPGLLLMYTWNFGPTWFASIAGHLTLSQGRWLSIGC